jgi:hypothetical protein
LNNSGCNLLREARTKAQENYLAGVIYSTCRVDLSRYSGLGHYRLLCLSLREALETEDAPYMPPLPEDKEEPHAYQVL